MRQDKVDGTYHPSASNKFKMNAMVSNITFNAPVARIPPRRRGMVTPKAMSENGVSARKKTTVHKLVDYFGAITVPGMYRYRIECIILVKVPSSWLRDMSYCDYVPDQYVRMQAVMTPFQQKYCNKLGIKPH